MSKYRYIFFLLFFILPAITSSQTITTYAGNGIDGFSGDGGQATVAKVNRPLEVHVDAAGDLFIADNDNHRIRKVNVVNGVIYTIAGNGNLGFAGDGGPATSASLNLPTAVCTDLSGNIFISDKSNQRIRKVDAGNGVITTYAGTGSSGFSGDGGPATAAMLSQPHGMQTDSAGNLYFADRTNHRVRRIDAITGIITTVAGTGTNGYSGDGGPAINADLNYPISLCLDDTGHLYIADQINHRIRKIDLNTGIITTVAGIGTPGFSGDGGASTAAELNQPYDVSVDAAGNLYISDTNNQRVRKVESSTGIISTIAGDGTSGYGGDGGPAASAQMQFPSGISTSPSGVLYISDKLNHRVRRVASCQNSVNVIADTACFSYTSPSGNFTWTSSGVYTDLLINAAGCDSIIIVNLTIDTVVTDVVAISTNLMALATNATYQWLDCDSGYAVIPGETMQTFNATTNGNYAVQVTQNGCTDTSDCVPVIGIGLNDFDVQDHLSIYPNPADGEFFVEYSQLPAGSEIIIFDPSARETDRHKILGTGKITVNRPEPGLYLVEIRTVKGSGVVKVIVAEGD